MRFWLAIACLCAAGLGCIHMVAAAILVGRFARRKEAARTESPSVTILKPLCGDEPWLEENLASFCSQDYPGPVQVVFGVKDPDDPAIAVVERLVDRVPGPTLELVVDPRRHGSNRKVSNLVNMAVRIRHDVVILSDSDMRVGPDYLARVAAELERPGVEGVTCLYHGLASRNVWSRLSALGIDAHFIPNVVMGLALGLARPCFGSTIAFRRAALTKIGGMERFVDTLADDYFLGMALRSGERQVVVPPFVIGHVCAEHSLAELWEHELRWSRTIRGIDPIGYAGSALTHGLPWALIACMLGGGGAAWIAVALTLAARALLCVRIERAFSLKPHPYWLLPLRDVLSFAVLLMGYAGRTVVWKNDRYDVGVDGTHLSKRRLVSS